MSITTILVILLIFLLLGGGGYGYHSGGFQGPWLGVGGLLVVVILVLFLTGHLGRL